MKNEDIVNFFTKAVIEIVEEKRPLSKPFYIVRSVDSGEKLGDGYSEERAWMDAANKVLHDAKSMIGNSYQKYRLIIDGEIIEHGDQSLNMDGVTWIDLNPLYIGEKFGRSFLPIRRKI